MVLECVELIEAFRKGQSQHVGQAQHVEEELGDVFYNLMAFSLSVRFDAEYMTLEMPESRPDLGGMGSPVVSG